MLDLIIGRTRFSLFESYSVTLAYNTIASAFNVKLLFDPNNAEHRRLLRPGSYQECTLRYKQEPLITGYILSVQFTDEPERQLVQISGYSLTGILEDCQYPPEFYPVQDDNVSLRQICERFIAPFNLGFEVDSWVAEDADKVFAETTYEPTQTIKEYLAKLASQRNIVLSHSAGGSLLLTRALVENQIPQATYTNGMPGVSMSLSFDGQGMFSNIYAFQEAPTDGGNACQAQVGNRFSSLTRPKVVIQNSGDDNDTELVAKMERAAQLGNIKLTIKVNKWENGPLVIRPNTIIAVRNPNIYLFENTKFFIESIEYIGNAKSTTATLNCVLPERYSGEEPSNIFNS